MSNLGAPDPDCPPVTMPTVEQVIVPRSHDIGGFRVARALPSRERRMVGPFIFLDHMGPSDFRSGQGVDVRPHPHIGLSTVTYLFEGEIMHRDSLANEQPIRPAEVNWMTAGRGITHSERFEKARARGDRVHGIQSWVALPAGDEECGPAFFHHAGGDLPSYEGDGLSARLIAGEAFGARAAVKTHSPMFYVHWQLKGGAKAQLPAEYPERAAYIVAGEVEIEGQRFVTGQMPVFARGTRSRSPPFRPPLSCCWAASRSARASSSGISSPRARSGSNRRKPIGATGALPGVPGETEFIPLPA